MIEELVWHRPEYRGRESELITLSGCAEIAGVTQTTISSWRTRYPGRFPAIVAESKRMLRLVVRTEFIEFLAQHQQRDLKRASHRPRAEILEAEIERLSVRLTTLRKREQRHMEALKKTQKDVEAAQKHLADAQEELRLLAANG
ncbi:hypothetical protein [Streptomyces sp. RTd22]|uniref:hypothetical protein n=1 Tax=Streptomyces sp. RTd22 TaxID=1841249 RepID=UPI0007C599A0|nr:hypothetical protein [Streptomyces sp. RTd22]